MIQKIKAFIWLLPYLGIIVAQDDQTLIRYLYLRGNENVSRNEVLFIIRQRPPNFFFRRPNFDPRLLRLDALTLKNYYYSKGFLDVKINESYSIEDVSKENKYADITFDINEGILDVRLNQDFQSVIIDFENILNGEKTVDTINNINISSYSFKQLTNQVFNELENGKVLLCKLVDFVPEAFSTSNRALIDKLKFFQKYYNYFLIIKGAKDLTIRPMGSDL